MRSALLGACSFEGVLYAVGGPYSDGTLYRFTGRRWSQEGSMLHGERLWSCWAGPSNQLIAVGQNGTIFRRNNEGWHRDQVPEEVLEADLYGVWGMPDGTAIAVGGGLPSPRAASVILHFDGVSTWTRADAENIATQTLRSVWGTGADNYWAVGDDGAAAHYDGIDWRPSPTQVDDRLYGIYGSGPNDVYAVGGSGRGLILRWNGSSWVEFDEPPSALRSVVTSPNGPLYVAGNSGYVARYPRKSGLPSSENSTEATPFPHLRINALVGLGSAVMGAASTMDTDEETGDWKGGVVGHNRSFAGVVFDSNRPPDAGVPLGDAGIGDAGIGDAGPTPDATP
tara:strand:+ start:89939 stop:90955 length:1017 start_codon:yes stop_codon:yes gene_type:complete